MNIINKRINELIAAAGTHASAHERESNAQMLRNFVLAYGISQRITAVRDQKKIFEGMNLVPVDNFALALLSAKMKDLSGYSADALDSAETREWLRQGADHIKNYEPPEPRESDELSASEFTTDDPDVDALIQITISLVSGMANMETGITWAEALSKVQARLKSADESPKHKQGDEPAEQRLDPVALHALLNSYHGARVNCYQDEIEKAERELVSYVQGVQPEVEIDTVDLYQTRYRIHMVIANILGRLRLGLFKNTGQPLSYILDAQDSLSYHVLFTALGDEFGIKFDADARTKMANMTSDDLLMAINAIPNKKGLGQ